MAPDPKIGVTFAPLMALGLPTALDVRRGQFAADGEQELDGGGIDRKLEG